MAPRVKRLTSIDVANIIDQDLEFQKKLLDRMMETSGVPYDVLRPALRDAIAKLREPVKRDVVTYRLSCKSCGINRLLESADWENSGIAITCCTCGTAGTFHFPKAEMLITCAVCGVESWIRRVEPEE